MSEIFPEKVAIPGQPVPAKAVKAAVKPNPAGAEGDYTHNRQDANVHAGSYPHHPAPHLVPAPMVSDASGKEAVEDDGELKAV
jgi:hypothetical protein